MLNIGTAACTEYIKPVQSVLGGRVKRTFDFLVALFMLVMLAPWFLFIVFLVKTRDSGPVFYRHERVGYKGKNFCCYKFRTMIVGSETILKTLLESDLIARAEWERDRKIKNDPRITRLGLILRRSSADELPQLINVLLGDMSLVGARPIVTEELKKYGEAVGLYLSARPGITGSWQISGRSDCSYEQRVKLDADYIRNWNFVTDISILYRSLFAVFQRRGSY